MVKQNWNDREVLVFEKYEIRQLMSFIKPEYDKRKKKYQKYKAKLDELESSKIIIADDNYKNLQKKCLELKQNIRDIEITYDYFKRFTFDPLRTDNDQ